MGFRLIVLLLAAIVVCLVPGDDCRRAFELNDKLSHLIGHWRAGRLFRGPRAAPRLVEDLPVLLLFGVAIEVAQYYMHVGRDGDPRDVVANCAGCCSACWWDGWGSRAGPGSVNWLVTRRGAARMTPGTRPAQPDLLRDAAPDDALRPLADRMRPRTLDEFVGQEQVLGAGKPLRQALERGQLHSLILWGPPGTGKTTLARLIARRADARVHAALGRHGGRQGHPRSGRARAHHARANAAAARCCSSTRCIASTSRSRTRSCPTSRTAR